MAGMIPELREVPSWLERGQQPAQAVAGLLRRHRTVLAEANAETARARQQAGRVVEAVGLALYKKRGTPSWPELRVLFEAFRDVGAEFVTHVGEPFEGDLEELADVLEWLDSAEGIAPGCVAEAFEPEIRLNGMVVHRAKLICVLEEPVPDERRGAGVPASEKHDSESSSLPSPAARNAAERGAEQ